jgi:rod shape-determining protein MreC
MFPKKYGAIAVAALLILTSLIILSYSAKQTSDTGFLRRLVLEASRPVKILTQGMFRALNENWERYLFLVGLEEENRRLLEEKHRLENELVRYREGYLESLRLQKILKIRENPDTLPVVADVIDREQSPVFRSILINKGTAHGLKVGLPVLSDQGIAGRITECSWHVSRVMLVVDENSKIPALLQQGRTQGILQGAGATGCRLKYIPKKEEVAAGDMVISSGLGGIFPKGIILGVVTAADKREGGLFQSILVQPSVDFSKLEQAVVLIERRDTRR